MLLDAEWSSFRAGDREVGDILAIAETTVAHESSGAVVGQAAMQLGAIGEAIAADGELEAYRAWVSRVASPGFARLDSIEDDERGRARESELLSDILLVDDSYRSPAEWELEPSAHDPDRFQLRSYRTGHYLTTRGLAEDESEAAVFALYPRTDCAEFPELTLDAEGTVERRTWDDGAVFGFVEMHSHPFTNFGFGGGGMFHGSPFHRLGVEHALPSCEAFHGAEGRSDLIG